MKKRIMTLAIAGVMSMAVLAGCGEEAPAETVVAEPTAEATEAEATEAPEAPEATEEVSEDVEAVFVDGYYANDGETDMMLAFFEVGDADIAYVTDGENEFCSEYTVEEAETDDGDAYLLVSFTDVDAKLGYIDNGDGEYYLVDEEGNIYAAAQLTEDDVEALYAIVLGGSDAEATASDDSEYTYDSGFYVTDGSSDAVICFFAGADGSQVAYINDGENEAFAEYDAEEAELDDGTPYVLVTVGDETLGYFTDGEDSFIIDGDGNVLGAAELSEAEANAILEAVAE